MNSCHDGCLAICKVAWQGWGGSHSCPPLNFGNVILGVGPHTGEEPTSFKICYVNAQPKN